VFADLTEQALQWAVDPVQGPVAAVQWTVAVHRTRATRSGRGVVHAIAKLLFELDRANMNHLIKPTKVLGRWRQPALSLRQQKSLLKHVITPRNCQQLLDGKVQLTESTRAVVLPLLSTYITKWEGRYNGEVKEFRANKGHKFEKKLLDRYVLALYLFLIFTIYHINIIVTE
jgi:hypothetical protein